MKKAWEYGEQQYLTANGRTYNVYAAIQLAKNLPVEDVDIRLIYRASGSPCDNSFTDFVKHVKSVIDADKSYPIIIADDGAIIDGRHRLAKAMIDGDKTIKAVIFESVPEGCYTLGD